MGECGGRGGVLILFGGCFWGFFFILFEKMLSDKIELSAKTEGKRSKNIKKKFNIHIREAIKILFFFISSIFFILSNIEIFFFFAFFLQFMNSYFVLSFFFCFQVLGSFFFLLPISSSSFSFFFFFFRN